VKDEKLTLRERVKRIFAEGKVDRVPWFADLSWWHNAHEFRGTLPEEYRGTEGIVNLHRELGCGIYLQPLDPWRFKFDCPHQTEQEGHDTITTYTTPSGSLRQVVQFIPDQYTFIFKEYFIKSSDDLPAFRYLIESQTMEPDYEHISKHEDLIGDTGVVVVCLPRTPLSKLMVEMAGVETTTLMALEEEDEFHSLVELMKKYDEPAYTIAAGAPGEFAMFPDNLSSDILSPSFFKTYTLDYYGQRSKQLHEAGKTTMAHIDGMLRGLLPLLRQSGVACAEAITPAPIGDVRPEELRGLTGDEIVLWGGVPGAMLVPGYSEDDLITHVTQYLNVMKSNPRFVLGIGDQMPPNGDMRRIKLITDLVEEFGSPS